jgi:hypothetical protein
MLDKSRLWVMYDQNISSNRPSASGLRSPFVDVNNHRAAAYRVGNPLLRFAIDQAPELQLKIGGNTVLMTEATTASRDKLEHAAIIVPTLSAQRPSSLLYGYTPIETRPKNLVEQVTQLFKKAQAPAESLCLISIRADTGPEVILTFTARNDLGYPRLLCDDCRNPEQFRLAIQHLLNLEPNDHSLAARIGRELATHLFIPLANRADQQAAKSWNEVPQLTQQAVLRNLTLGTEQFRRAA